MALEEFRRIQPQDEDLRKIQENLRLYFGQLNKTVLDGVILEDVSVGTSTTSVPHGLARKYQGWQILDIHGDARVWRDTTSTLDNTKYLPLKASSAVTVKLWVF